MTARRLYCHGNCGHWFYYEGRGRPREFCPRCLELRTDDRKRCPECGRQWHRCECVLTPSVVAMSGEMGAA